MNDENSFRRIAGITAIISAPLALAAVVVLTMAVEFNFELMSDQARLITLGARAAELFRLGEILGLFGYSLLLVPVVLYLWDWLKPRSPNLVTMYTVFGLAFIFIGAVGASLRAAVLPEMMSAYAQAASAQGQILSTIFQTVIDVIFGAIGPLESLLSGLWLLGIGLVLRGERRGLGIIAVILGIAFLGTAFGDMLQVEPLSMLEMTYFISPIWVLWLGIVIWRRGEQSEHIGETATAV
ncbi:MAG: DUF4386 family protein [Chloroflexota bacterium]|jgi:hypothetical protein